MLRSRTCFGSSVFALRSRRHRCGDVLDLLLRGGPALGAGQSLNEMQGEVDAGGDPAGAHQVAVITTLAWTITAPACRELVQRIGV